MADHSGGFGIMYQSGNGMGISSIFSCEEAIEKRNKLVSSDTDCASIKLTIIDQTQMLAHTPFVKTERQQNLL